MVFYRFHREIAEMFWPVFPALTAVQSEGIDERLAKEQVIALVSLRQSALAVSDHSLCRELSCLACVEGRRLD